MGWHNPEAIAPLFSLGFPFTLLVHGFTGPQVPPQVERSPEEDPILLDVQDYQGEVFKYSNSLASWSTRSRKRSLHSLTQCCNVSKILRYFVVPSVPYGRHLVLGTSLPPVPCNTQMTTKSWEMVLWLKFDSVKFETRTVVLIACPIDETVTYTQVCRSPVLAPQTVNQVYAKRMK